MCNCFFPLFQLIETEEGLLLHLVMKGADDDLSPEVSVSESDMLKSMVSTFHFISDIVHMLLEVLA